MSREPESVRDLLDQRVSVPPFVRILLAVAVIAGGLAFSLLGAILFFREPPAPYPHPAGAVLFSVAMAAMGAGFLWIGWRLVRMRAESSNLLSPIARRRCSFIVGVLAACMLAAAVEARSLMFLAAAVAFVPFSYWLFPLEDH